MVVYDRIHGTQEQYLEIYEWLEENNPQFLKLLFPWQGDSDFGPISKFGGYADLWLLNNCPIEWLLNDIREQYGLCVINGTRKAKVSANSV